MYGLLKNSRIYTFKKDIGKNSKINGFGHLTNACENYREEEIHL